MISLDRYSARLAYDSLAGAVRTKPVTSSCPGVWTSGEAPVLGQLARARREAQATPRVAWRWRAV